MKRCPECRRDYYDDSLLYCLDDGSALVEGPASGDEPATAVLSKESLASELRTQLHAGLPEIQGENGAAETTFQALGSTSASVR